MIKCERHRALIPESTCIARMKIVKKTGAWNTHQRITALDAKNSCGGCEIGEKLLRGESVMEHQETKICRICGEKKSRKDFYKNKAASDGLESLCKQCKYETAKARNRGGGVVLAQCVRSPEEMEGVKEAISQKQDTIKKNNHEINLDDLVKQVFERAGHPNLYKALEKQAYSEFRTPALQMVAIISGSC